MSRDETRARSGLAPLEKVTRARLERRASDMLDDPMNDWGEEWGDQ